MGISSGSGCGEGEIVGGIGVMLVFSRGVESGIVVGVVVWLEVGCR